MPPRAPPNSRDSPSRPNPFHPDSLGPGPLCTPARDVPGGRPRCPAGPLAHQLQIENQGHLLAIPWRACSETLPGHDEASGGHAPDCVQQLFYEAQLLQGATPALSRKHRMRSLTRHAGSPRRTPRPAAATGKGKPGPHPATSPVGGLSFSADHPPQPGMTKLMAQDGALEMACTDPAPPPRQIKDLSLAGGTWSAF